MAKTTYIAIDPNGVEHTRKSDRVYTHTVFYKDNYEAQIAEYNRPGWAKTDASNYDYYARCAAKGRPSENLPEWERNNEARYIDEGKAIVEKYPTKAAYMEAMHAARIKIVDDRKAAGHFDKWLNAGWCGRLDLAQKLAAKYSGYVIVEAGTK